MDVAARLAALDWDEITGALDAHGWARTPPVVTADECGDLSALWDEDGRFRSHVDMARYRFGQGDYKYFAPPLPPLIQSLRTGTYRPLAELANRWSEALGTRDRYPLDLPTFLARCHERGQTKPTPLLLRYEPGGYNCLHQDVYGEVVFPVQLTVFLSRPGVDYDGGQFLLVEQRPRAQSRGEAIVPRQGEAVVFATRHRPVRGARGHFRATVRHGVSTVTRGTRFTLGVIFHDAA
jgi:hypothetical protein